MILYGKHGARKYRSTRVGKADDTSVDESARDSNVDSESLTIRFTNAIARLYKILYRAIDLSAMCLLPLRGEWFRNDSDELRGNYSNPRSQNASCDRTSPANRRDVTSRCARRTFSFNLRISLRSQFSSAFRPIEPFAISNTFGKVPWSMQDCFSQIFLDAYVVLFIKVACQSLFAPSL